jgi:hypothetical protein
MKESEDEKSLRVSFESPQSGFMSVGLTAGGERLLFGASCAPYDSLRELIDALSALLTSDGATRAVARWNCEPEEYDFHLSADAGRASLTVIHHPTSARRGDDARPVFTHADERLALVLPFWRELRQLRRRAAEDVFERNWRRPFPERELRELTRLVRARKRVARQK